MAKRPHPLDEKLRELWRRCGRVDGGSERDWEELYRVIEKALRDYGPRFSRWYAALRDSGATEADFINEFFLYKVLQPRRRSPNPDGDIHVGALCDFYGRFLIDRIRRAAVRIRTVPLEHAPAVPSTDDPTPRYAVPAPKIVEAARRFLGSAAEWERLYLALHFCPEGEQATPLLPLAQRYEIASHHYKAQRLGITIEKARIGDFQSYRETTLGKWLVELEKGTLPFICHGCYIPGMPRLARTVCARVPHHITQRGNRREEVFFSDADRTVYLGWLREYAEKHEVDILAYCLMTNHIHLIAVPATEDGLQRTLKPLHMRYAQRANRLHGWKGHLWQGRFFSSALDEDYLWAAMRYVERNPVRARMVRKAERYRWSSAAAHCGLRHDPVLSDKSAWRRQFESIGDWSAWLAEGDEPERLEILRRNVEKGLPCGSETFIRRLEKMTGRALQYRPRGRPKKEQGE